MSPGTAGRDVTPGMAPTGATNVVLLAIWMTPCVAEFVVLVVKIPGDAANIGTVIDGLVPAAVVTVRLDVGEESNSHGT